MGEKPFPTWTSSPMLVSDALDDARELSCLSTHRRAIRRHEHQGRSCEICCVRAEPELSRIWTGWCRKLLPLLLRALWLPVLRKLLKLEGLSRAPRDLAMVLATPASMPRKDLLPLDDGLRLPESMSCRSDW